ncbi:MAG: hypothetical protein ACHQNT_00410 [Bacteroidia bacterium]
MKNKLLSLPAICMLVTSLSIAQPGEKMEERKENIEAMKIGFLTKRLDLTPDEAKTFWPVYNQFQNELEALRKSRRGERKEAKDEFANMPDKDVEKMVDGEIAFRQNELDIMKKYHAQFKQVLPIKKVASLYRTEEDFKRELLNRLQDRKKEMRDHPKGPGR